jgi:hypothetical protein
MGRAKLDDPHEWWFTVETFPVCPVCGLKPDRPVTSVGYAVEWMDAHRKEHKARRGGCPAQPPP